MELFNKICEVGCRTNKTDKTFYEKSGDWADIEKGILFNERFGGLLDRKIGTNDERTITEMTFHSSLRYKRKIELVEIGNIGRCRRTTKSYCPQYRVIFGIKSISKNEMYSNTDFYNIFSPYLVKNKGLNFGGFEYGGEKLLFDNKYSQCNIIRKNSKRGNTERFINQLKFVPRLAVLKDNYLTIQGESMFKKIYPQAEQKVWFRFSSMYVNELDFEDAILIINSGITFK